VKLPRKEETNRHRPDCVKFTLEREVEELNIIYKIIPLRPPFSTRRETLLGVEIKRVVSSQKASKNARGRGGVREEKEEITADTGDRHHKF